MLDLFPSSGPAAGGTILTLVGTNFGIVNSIVTVGDQQCVINSIGPNLLTCILPIGQSSSRPVVIFSGSSSSNALFFNYDPPTVFGVSPGSGNSEGNTIITISGILFMF